MNPFIFPGVYPHRPSPISFRPPPLFAFLGALASLREAQTRAAGATNTHTYTRRAGQAKISFWHFNYSDADTDTDADAEF
jgi:hypothetical protein